MNISSKAKCHEKDFYDSYSQLEYEFENGIAKPASSEARTRHNLQFLLKTITEMDFMFENVECYGQEVPCIRSVRELACRFKVQFCNEYGTFNRVLSELCQMKVSGISRVITRVERLRSNISMLGHDEACYLKYLEDVRQLLGEISGIVETILNVEYGKR